jgi:hypothetical protein
MTARSWRNFLVRSGGFLPFDVESAMTNNWRCSPPSRALGERPPSSEVLRAFADGTKTDRERLQAVALVSDATLADGGDAVRVQLQHGEGVVVEILVPYRHRRVGRNVTTLRLSVSDGERCIWVD